MPELLQAVPVRWDRVGRCPLLRSHGGQFNIQIADDRVAVVVAVPGLIAQGERGMRVQGREIPDQIVEPAEVTERGQVDRIADPDHGAAAVLDRGLWPLQHDLLGEPVDRHGDRVLGALNVIVCLTRSQPRPRARHRITCMALPCRPRSGVG